MRVKINGTRIYVLSRVPSRLNIRYFFQIANILNYVHRIAELWAENGGYALRHEIANYKYSKGYFNRSKITNNFDKTTISPCFPAAKEFLSKLKCLISSLKLKLLSRNFSPATRNAYLNANSCTFTAAFSSLFSLKSPPVRIQSQFFFLDFY